jgi:predicted component of type VI protein secretion system
VLEQIARTIQAVLERIETRLDRIETRFDTRMERLDGRQADDFRYLVRLQITLTTVTIGLTLAGLGTLGGMMAHGFHWL